MDNRAVVERAISKRGTATVAELTALGLSRPSLYRALKALEEDGAIVRVRRGSYRRREPDATTDSWSLVMHQYPKGVLCLLSALLFHQLTTQAPVVVWLALPRGARRQIQTWPRVKPIYMSGNAYSTGIEIHQRSAGTLRVYTAAKTVADCFKFRRRVGLDVAIEALREGWGGRRFTLDELDAAARACRVQAVMRPYIEALVA